MKNYFIKTISIAFTMFLSFSMFGQEVTTPAVPANNKAEETIVPILPSEVADSVALEVELSIEDGERIIKKKKWKSSYQTFDVSTGASFWLVPNEFSDAWTNYSGTGALSEKSHFLQLAHYTHHRLFFKRSPLWLKTGVQLNTQLYSFDQNVNVIKYNDILEYDGILFENITQNGETARHNSLSVSTLEIPLLLVFDPSRRGDKKFTVAAGGYAGLRLGGATRFVVYRDYSGAIYREETVNDFYTSRVSYGLQAQVGYKHVKLSGRLGMNTVFRQDKDDATGGVVPASVGLGWSF